ncbi:MAG TPA: hypothetical protein VN873_10315 [Candidatus Angelobacter sp.]|nr:hypothetical protein [Candidatus Angelobacter sp.]
MTTIHSTRLFITAILLAGVSVAGAGTISFANTNAIVINDSNTPPTESSPYPSTIQVTGLEGSAITKVTVQLTGFAHTFPSDVDIVLVGPGGQNAVLMRDTGGQEASPVTNVDLTLDDDAAENLPVDSPLVSGTFKPTQAIPFTFGFPAPGPTTNSLMGPFLSNFDNTGADGTWSLFVVDDTSPDSGVITGGWTLNLTTAPVLLSIATAGTNAVLSWTNALTGFTLQSTPTLNPPAWTAVATVPVVVSGNYTVTNAIGNGAVFYRLAR